MKIFICQNSVLQTDEDLEAERNDILEWASNRFENVQEIPIFSQEQSYGRNTLYMLGLSLKLMSDADCVIFGPGWDMDRACEIEHLACYRYRVRYIELTRTKSGSLLDIFDSDR